MNFCLLTFDDRLATLCPCVLAFNGHLLANQDLYLIKTLHEQRKSSLSVFSIFNCTTVDNFLK